MKRTDTTADEFQQLIAARRLRLLLAGVTPRERADVQLLRLSVRSAEKQEEIDALELGAMAQRYA